MKTIRNIIASLFSPVTREVFAHVVERARDNPVPWFLFAIMELSGLLGLGLLFFNALHQLFPS